MEVNNYRPRTVDDQIERYLKMFSAVVVEGPKYCGKTWAGRKHAESEALLYDPTGEGANLVELAKISPQLVLAGKKPRLIDEWQNATNLWDAIRYDVDASGLKGQYILTGSSTPNRKGINHSGAGRFGKIRMRTMSLWETGDSSGKVSLQDISEGKEFYLSTGEVSLRHLAHLILRGGFPGNIALSSEDAVTANREYLKLIIDDDVERVDGKKRDKHKMYLLLKSLARNECTTVSDNVLQRDIFQNEEEDISKITLRDYLDILDKLYLLDNDEPYSSNVRSSIRVKQQEKRHFADPSLAACLLQLTEEKMIRDLKTFGFLFESLAEHDLKVYASSFDGLIFHYQDYASQEIDSVLELPNGDYCAFEVKLGANQIEKAAQNLLSIKDKISLAGGKPPLRLCVICGMSNAAYLRKDGVYVVPLTALKN